MTTTRNVETHPDWVDTLNTLPLVAGDWPTWLLLRRCLRELNAVLPSELPEPLGLSRGYALLLSALWDTEELWYSRPPHERATTYGTVLGGATELNLYALGHDLVCGRTAAADDPEIRRQAITAAVSDLARGDR